MRAGDLTIRRQGLKLVAKIMPLDINATVFGYDLSVFTGSNGSMTNKLGHIYTATELRQIANKLDELNGVKNEK